MQENKNLTPETEIEEAVNTPKKPKREKLIKNQALFKKGGFSLAFTAIFIVAVIVFNILVGALCDRFVLEFDMTRDAVNTIDTKNIDYIKKVNDDIKVIFTTDQDTYDYYSYLYAYNRYGISDSAASEYFKQTVKLINKYNSYNDKIDVQFIDMYSSEFVDINSKYGSHNLTYGDIIVSCEKDDNERVKVLRFEDIYDLYEDTTNSYYGYSSYQLVGNKIETALTSAISYVTSAVTKTVGIITGHSAEDYTVHYRELLEANNYEIVDIDSKVLTSIPEEVDTIVIPAPSRDFTSEEIFTIEEFLNNDEKLEKGMVFFADPNAPYLTALYDFLLQWGIQVDEGILFETESDAHIPDDPFTLYTETTSAHEKIEGRFGCLTGYNAPLSAVEASSNSIKATSVIDTYGKPVAAPKGVDAGWKGYKDYTPKTYSGLVCAQKESYDNEAKKEISSYIMAFSSIEFIYSNYIGNHSNIVLSYYATETALDAEDAGIFFDSKIITEESFEVTEADANTVKTLFMYILPLACIVASVVVFIRRRNA